MVVSPRQTRIQTNFELVPPSLSIAKWWVVSLRTVIRFPAHLLVLKSHNFLEILTRITHAVIEKCCRG